MFILAKAKKKKPNLYARMFLSAHFDVEVCKKMWDNGRLPARYSLQVLWFWGSSFQKLGMDWVLCTLARITSVCTWHNSGTCSMGLAGYAELPHHSNPKKAPTRWVCKHSQLMHSSGQCLCWACALKTAVVLFRGFQWGRSASPAIPMLHVPERT